MIKIEGGCLCGAIRYRSDASPQLTAVCHCRHCQRQSGTSFSVIVGIAEGSLHFAGPSPTVYRDAGDSGMAVDRYFCAACGSPIYTTVASMPGLDFIKAGTLDDPSGLQPQMHIWCEHAQPWVPIDGDMPQLPRNPPAG